MSVVSGGSRPQRYVLRAAVCFAIAVAGVVLGVVPNKGITLPLVSYGGSGILLNCVAIAVLLRVDYENRVLMRGGKV